MLQMVSDKLFVISKKHIHGFETYMNAMLLKAYVIYLSVC